MELGNKTKPDSCVFGMAEFALCWRVRRNENRVWTLLDQSRAREGLVERAVVIARD